MYSNWHDGYSEGEKRGYREGEKQGYKEGEKEGYKEGEEKKLIELICKKMKKNCSAEEIADLLEEDKEKVEAIYNTVLDFAPDYNIEKIWRKLGGGKKTAAVWDRPEHWNKQNSPWHMGKCKGCFAVQKKKEA